MALQLINFSIFMNGIIKKLKNVNKIKFMVYNKSHIYKDVSIC